MTRTLCSAALPILAFGTACQPFHLPGGGYDDGPQIGEHGISVPVPPPSLTAAPVQKVDVEGDLNDPEPQPDALVYLWVYTKNGEFLKGYTVPAEPDGTFVFVDDIELDLTDNCIEVWFEGKGFGEESMHSFFHAKIADDDQSVRTEQFFSGCI